MNKTNSVNVHNHTTWLVVDRSEKGHAVKVVNDMSWKKAETLSKGSK